MKLHRIIMLLVVLSMGVFAQEGGIVLKTSHGDEPPNLYSEDVDPFLVIDENNNLGVSFTSILNSDPSIYRGYYKTQSGS